MHIHTLPVLAFALLMATSGAYADEYQDVQRLAASGRTAEALAQIERTLQTRPRDPQMRFLQGVIQADAGRTDEAVKVYEDLIAEFPELPEPYNNLAVLLVRRSEFGRARTLLEQAIRNKPDYATAHENLGDVQARLAAASWQRAAQLDPAHTTAAPKLVLVRQWLEAASQAKPQPDTPPGPVRNSPSSNSGAPSTR